MNPLVSIIIPCWNAEEFVEGAIQSSFAQDYPRIEVICIDDGSIDRSVEVIQSFGDRLRWISGSNMGGSVARNRGIGLARGEFIQFLDADDVLFPSKLSKQVPLAVANPDRLTYSDYQLRYLTTGEVEVRSRPVTDLDPFVFVLHHRTLTISAPLYRRRWLTDIGGFKEGLLRSQEFEMNLRLANHIGRFGGGFVHLPDVLFEIRRRAGSVSSNAASTFSVKVEYLPEVVELLERWGMFTPHRRSELAAYAASIGRQCIRGGRVSEGLGLIELADTWDKGSADARAWGSMSRLVKRIAGPLAAERLAFWKRNRIDRQTV